MRYKKTKKKELKVKDSLPEFLSEEQEIELAKSISDYKSGRFKEYSSIDDFMKDLETSKINAQKLSSKREL